MYGEPNPPPSKENLGTTLIIIVSVVFTIIAAIYLSIADGLLVRLPPPVLPTQVALAPTSTPIPPTEDPPKDTPTATKTPTVTPTSSPTTRPQPTSTVTPTPSPEPTTVVMVAEQSCGNVPDGWVSYIVQRGDTISQLSMRSGATINEIVQANCLSLNILYSGTRIFLPSTAPVRQPCGPPLSWVGYVVQRKDTLFSLAQNHGTTVYAIMQANCLVDSEIFYGRRIFLPPTIADGPPTIASTDSPPVTTATPGPQPPATNVPPASAPVTLYRIDSPTAGEQVSGFVPIIGSASFNPNEVQYYKLEIGSGASPTSWTTFGSTHRNSVTNGLLETLHAYSLPPGDYVIRLVIVRNDGNFPPPSTVPISIVS